MQKKHIMEDRFDHHVCLAYDQPLVDISMSAINYLNMEAAYVQSIYQRPNEVCVIHTDRSHSIPGLHDYMNSSDEKNIMRYLICLEDWQPGHYLFALDQIFQWKAGDMFAWDGTILHGSANAGFTPKMTLTLTGAIST